MKTLKKLWNGAKQVFRKVVEPVRLALKRVDAAVAPYVRPLLAVAKPVAVAAAVVAIGAFSVFADTNAPDASTIVSTAADTFDTVGGLVASAVGFFIIVKIVKWIRR
jgi:hypothetical protein